MKGRNMDTQDNTEKAENWYGSDSTLEEALEATAALRDSEINSQFFEAKKGQVLQAKQHIHDMPAGGLAIVLKDGVGHDMFLHPEIEKRYMGYSSNYSHFKAASDERVKLFFGEEAKIEEEPAAPLDGHTNPLIGAEEVDDIVPILENNNDLKVEGDISIDIPEDVATTDDLQPMSEVIENAIENGAEVTTELPAETVQDNSENADEVVEENTTESADDEDLPETTTDDTKSE